MIFPYPFSSINNFSTINNVLPKYVNYEFHIEEFELNIKIYIT